MADKNVSIIFSDTDGTGYGTMYFPGCSVYRGLEKDIRIISMSGYTRYTDLLRADDSIRIVGQWHNDTHSEYDGLTALAREEMFYNISAKVVCYGIFSWSSGGYSETQYVVVNMLNSDQTPGQDWIDYNFMFAVLSGRPE